jgi:acetyl-CoA synthetase|eukprot:TRINITY_DN15643_c0_g2_i2.p1 TRINITY_DN15643_c0_g2~~TRINITY_DN15643_c0_g2_i2.p1  ORF type:complete len:705 (+),score=379.73 TRINITY_DN15643_c0_g2_i2:119-2116(+)
MSGADDDKAPNGGPMYDVTAHMRTEGAVVPSMAAYREQHAASVADPAAFWGARARADLTWVRDFDTVTTGTLEDGDVTWFGGGVLNVSANCVDRHQATRAEQVAILWEGDEPTDVRRITYRELYLEVNRLANALRALGVRRGDNVCIYMPMVPEAAYAMLACARIGAPHSVVFAGFSADALRDRIVDARCGIVLCADEGVRGRRTIPLKRTVDKAVAGIDFVRHVMVLQRTGNPDVPMAAPRDVLMRELMDAQRPYCPPEPMDSEDNLFLLYTSGSTGKPKGIVHTQAGYLLFAAYTHRTTFDYRDGDVYACMADVGWITGHTYIVYGPLANGATTMMFEGVPGVPDAGRYWDMVERHGITSFYTAPTALRYLMKYGDEFPKKYDLSSLRVLGTVGEPINPEAWRWYYEVIGAAKCAVVDTFWQTESGGHLLTPAPCATPLKAGSATLPFAGVEPVILDERSGEVREGNDVRGVLAIAQPWPGMCRTIYGDHQRYLNTYFRAYPGYYFTGDGAWRDQDGYYWITGRVDDVLNVSGHRIGTAEIESALVAHASCAEAAVVGIPHDVKGQAIFAYCTLAEGCEDPTAAAAALRQEVRSVIGPFATPDHVVVTPGLPKTRSGKIMRRLLRKIASRESSPEQLGDTSTLADESVVQVLIDIVEAQFSKA